MILLFSDPKDGSTGVIIEWLSKSDETLLILTPKVNNFIDIATISGEKIILNINDNEYNITDIKAIYYRRSSKIISNVYLKKITTIKNSRIKSLSDYIEGNFNTTNELLNFYLKDKKTFGTEGIGRINKILALQIAKKVGLKTPETIITSSKKVLMEFYLKNNPIIIKSIDIGYRYEDNKYWHVSYTNIISPKEIKNIPAEFPLSLFQKKIEKYFEIRCFYFHDNFYSTAIFSQNNPKTNVDYRRYDFEFPNRQVPYILPDNIIYKLKLLFKLLRLNTGSIDIIFTGLDYYFLEINPVGQFENVSLFGNWYIERNIADYLLHD